MVFFVENRHSMLTIVINKKSKVSRDGIGWNDWMLRGKQGKR